MLLVASVLGLAYPFHYLFIHCAERFVVMFNLETHVIEFWKVFYYFFDNFLSSVVFILFLEQLLVGVRLLELIL